jgi:hypothetical protein
VLPAPSGGDVLGKADAEQSLRYWGGWKRPALVKNGRCSSRATAHETLQKLVHPRKARFLKAVISHWFD